MAASPLNSWQEEGFKFWHKRVASPKVTLAAHCSLLMEAFKRVHKQNQSTRDFLILANAFYACIYFLCIGFTSAVGKMQRSAHKHIDECQC
uniref:Uncharacterized protein n=1 Tax=Pyxicephalus adspersus TaxID=30357 RepID=A0AAV3AM61_PYXAD|nr:TPA: hypothetical protein GDO54_008093 [Pyxicephalus adspersus]